MRKSIVATIATLGLSASMAFAGTVNKSYTACARDGKSVTIIFTIDEERAQGHDVYSHVSATFKSLADKLTSQQLIHAGPTFWASVPDEIDTDAVDVNSEPTVTGTCNAN